MPKKIRQAALDTKGSFREGTPFLGRFKVIEAIGLMLAKPQPG